MTYHLGKLDLRQTLLENNLSQVCCDIKKDKIITFDDVKLNTNSKDIICGKFRKVFYKKYE